MEDDTIFCWEIFLKDCEDGKTKTSLNDILAFISGDDVIPPMGFEDSIDVEFFTPNPDAIAYPTASTCALELHMPRGMEDPVDFRNLFEEAILNGKGLW
ncbi:G2/M phase-specific E3 ubiquitin-protein ligase-like [Anneissia japonica]|uniref:G2/M phase-specific E3 ubiquitin-protein ligase-like n=1 Tax=Anneissia japonica TaxID=1529436 RepID=UPI0014255788|nr:G2/M phase-specific E3 ubiquitin-protein ligase-like [Anneissia japonica]